ncbi:MAG: hypothetical protein RLZZ308_210 [Candidatus Parcubacteria bacterium]|jgi:hypothetical protein
MRSNFVNNNDLTNEELPEFQNAVNFFALLIKIDKRTNPHLYQNNKTIISNDRYNMPLNT